jgi:hypothetical protein
MPEAEGKGENLTSMPAALKYPFASATKKPASLMVLTMPTDTGSAAVAPRAPATTAGATGTQLKTFLRVRRVRSVEAVAIGIFLPSCRRCGVDFTVGQRQSGVERSETLGLGRAEPY